MKFTVSKYFLFNLYMCIITKKTFHFIFIPDDASADDDLFSIADCLVKQSKYLCFLESVFCCHLIYKCYPLVNEIYCK